MRFTLLVLAILFQVPSALLAQTSAHFTTSETPSTTNATATNGTGFGERSPRYKLRGGDSFELQFAFSPELTQTVTVQPDGYITLKSIGTIPAEGLTIPELTEAIKQAYSGILHDPVITIDLKDFDKPYFVVSGQVGRPGKYDLRSDLTVTEGVAIAGGFTEASKHSQVVLFRPNGNGLTETRLLDVKKMLKERNLTEDVHLLPGDMIFVPQNRISKIQRYLPTSNLGMYGYPGNF
jgi:polysaccharide export outer membrane protein